MPVITEDEIYQKLNQKFGFKQFKPGQLEILRKLLANQDTLAILPTGAGKTLIYQMYGFLSEGTVIVISPLLSLIKDQINRLRLSGESNVAEITSQVLFVDQRRILSNLNRYKFVFMSPESLQRVDVQDALLKINIGLFVVDEAHCIPQWGKSFRPDYLRIGQVREKLGNPLTLMLTATASQQTRQAITQYLNVKNPEEYIDSVDRQNIFLNFLETDSTNDKQALLLEILNQLPGSGIIYFSSRKIANQISEWINDKSKLVAAPYHAGMTSYERFQIQKQFQNDQLNVICATSAFGMGIDKPNIRYVIHYHMPGDIESYVQEIGRAGRDGHQSVAIMLYTKGDEMIPSILNQASIPSPEELRGYLDNGDLDDEQKKLVEYYREYGLSNQELTELFKKQQIQNQQQIMKIKELINATDCRRKRLLKYFDEEFDGHNENCCGTFLNFESLNMKDRNINVQKMKPWKTRLHEIFAGI